MDEPNIKLSAKILQKHNFENSHNNLPCKMWRNSSESLCLELLKLKGGYWAILSKRQSGYESGRINLGICVYESELIKLIDVLESMR